MHFKGACCAPCSIVSKRWVRSWWHQLKLGAVYREWPASGFLRREQAQQEADRFMRQQSGSIAANESESTSACSESKPCKCQHPTAPCLRKEHTCSVPQEAKPESRPAPLRQLAALQVKCGLAASAQERGSAG